jgi:multiple sugar transport system substrate-binding protein
LAALLSACGGDGGGGSNALTWYINPDDGGQTEIADRCSAAANGAYRITTSLLPNDASSQREQLVRRLAAKDSSIDLMSLDPPFVPEAAQAGFLRPFTPEEAAPLTEGVIPGAVKGASWNGRLVAAPFWANTQLL